MPTASASRRSPRRLRSCGRIISDPHHLPRWWPRVERVEDVDGGAFTEVMRTRKGKTVRADFDLVRADEPAGTVRWEQRLVGTPFAGVLSSSETELRVLPAQQDAASDVTIEMRQELNQQTVTIAGAGACRASAPGCFAAPPRGRSRRRSTAWRGSVSEPPPADALVGVGAEGAGQPLPGARPRFPRGAPGRRRAPARARRASSRCGSSPRSSPSAPTGARRDRRGGRRANRPRRTGAARRRQGLPRPRAAARGRAGRRARRGRPAASHEQVRALLARCARALARGRAVRRRHERRRRRRAAARAPRGGDRARPGRPRRAALAR